jgi:hypothetical protein
VEGHSTKRQGRFPDFQEKQSILTYERQNCFVLNIGDLVKFLRKTLVRERLDKSQFVTSECRNKVLPVILLIGKLTALDLGVCQSM